MCLSKTARNGDILGVAFDEVSKERILDEGEGTKLTFSFSVVLLQGDFKSHADDPIPWDQKKEHLYWVCLRLPIIKSMNSDSSFPFRSEATRRECSFPFLLSSKPKPRLHSLLLSFFYFHSTGINHSTTESPGDSLIDLVFIKPSPRTRPSLSSPFFSPTPKRAKPRLSGSRRRS